MASRTQDGDGSEADVAATDRTRRTGYRVLLVEDNDLDARTVTKALSGDVRCNVERVEDLGAALEAIDDVAFDCILLDLSLPDSEGLGSVEIMVAQSPHCPVVVLTGLDDPGVAMEAVARGAQDYLIKNTMTPEVVPRAIRYAIARHSADTELVGAQQRLRSMQEREQIARDLHDTVIQRLFATGMTLQAAIGLQSHEELVDRTIQAVDEIDQAIRELREAIFGLHSLDAAESLAVEVARISDSYADGLGFEPVLRLGRIPSIPDEVRQDVFAVVREALSNVARHARATTATLTISADHGELLVRVADNGTGVTPEGKPDLGPCGYGIHNLAARAEAHGGSLDFDAGPTGGSELTWTVPLTPVPPRTGSR